MKKFSKIEQDIIRALIEFSDGQPFSIDKFLEKNFFTEKDGRALIIQTNHAHAAFYLKENIYQNEASKNEHISLFFKMLGLIKYLKDNGHISLYKSNKLLTKTMFFINDGFVNPVIGKNEVILNAHGYHSKTPDSILDKDNNVVYRGVEYKSDSFELISDNTLGLVIASESLNELLEPQEEIDVASIIEPETSNESNFLKSALSFAFKSILLILLTISSVYLGYNIGIKANDQLKEFNTRQINMENSLSEMKSEIKNWATLTPVNNSKTKQNKEYFGIDVSRWNGNIIDELNEKDNLSFVFCKASEGVTIKDKNFDHNWTTIKNQNLLRGAYHFYIAEDDPHEQANFFWNIISDMDSLDMAPVVDIESNSIDTGGDFDKIDMQVNLLVFLKTLKKLSGRTPMIYSGYYFANTYLNNPSFAKFPLWIADYNDTDKPRIPETWKGVGYKIWQRSDKYELESQEVDLDVFYGVLEDLYAK